MTDETNNMAQTLVLLAHIRKVLESKYAVDSDKMTEFFRGFPQYLWQILGQSRIRRRSFLFPWFLINYSPVTPNISTMFTDWRAYKDVKRSAVFWCSEISDICLKYIRKTEETSVRMAGLLTEVFRGIKGTNYSPAKLEAWDSKKWIENVLFVLSLYMTALTGCTGERKTSIR
jgi:hypothetical protein